jgi:rhodanese-related sulfurtransferase
VRNSFVRGRRLHAGIHPRLRSDSSWLAAAVFVAFFLGVAFDQVFRDQPMGLKYRTVAEIALQTGDFVTTGQEQIRTVGVEELEELLTRRDVIKLDARPREIFDLGHLPGASSLSREQFASDFKRLAGLLRRGDRTIIVYCADITCEDGAMVAKWLQNNGVLRPLVYSGGFDEWEASGRPIEANL